MLSALIQTGCEPELPDPTIQTVSKPRQMRLGAFRNRQNPSSNSTPPRGPSATLIVAPTSLLSQWHDELLRSSKPGTLKVFVWHGQNRLDLEAMLEQKDNDKTHALNIMITSYGTLLSEFGKMQGEKLTSPVFESKWLSLLSLELG